VAFGRTRGSRIHAVEAEPTWKMGREAPTGAGPSVNPHSGRPAANGGSGTIRIGTTGAPPEPVRRAKSPATVGEDPPSLADLADRDSQCRGAHR